MEYCDMEHSTLPLIPTSRKSEVQMVAFGDILTVVLFSQKSDLIEKPF